MDNIQAVGRGWIIFFWAAAIYNFAVGAAGMFVVTPDVDSRIIGLLVFAFGIVYALVARDPVRYARMLWAGIFGKVGVVALLGAGSFGPDGNSLTSVVLALDLLFALGFLVFLFTSSDAAARADSGG